MVTTVQLESLGQAISFDNPPFCSGAVSPSQDGFYLYYGKENPRFINFASATPQEIDQLAVVCNLTTFNRGNDVYDKSDRKAGSMDPSNFSAQFDPVRTGLIKTIEGRLLHGDKEKMYLRAEVHRLNVYGKGSSFRAHEGAPRGNMFGSLVVFYPTPHEGGQLVIHPKGRERTLDAGSLTSLRDSPSLAYVAFCGDIEHEILKVISGSRIALTYNLYLVDPPSADTAPIPSVTPSVEDTRNFGSALRTLLDSPEFLPDGGTLGFGLSHLYPITHTTKLRDMDGRLRGEDAYVYQACRELQLQPTLRAVYNEHGRDTTYGIMLDRIVELSYDYYVHDFNDVFEEMGGVVVNKLQDALVGDCKSELLRGGSFVDGEQICWVTPFNSRNQLEETPAMLNGEIFYVRWSPFLTARVPPASDRTLP